MDELLEHIREAIQLCLEVQGEEATEPLELAFKAGMHRTYLGSIERGERNPSLKNIAGIAKALGVSLSQLFSFEDQKSGTR